MFFMLNTFHNLSFLFSKFLTSFFNFSQKNSFNNSILNFKKHGVFFVNSTKKKYYDNIISFSAFGKVWVKKLKGSTSNWAVRFKAKDLSLNYYNSDFSSFSIQPLFYFLRKHKLFNKGRYSRNRQTYRTGAYWSLWVNILAVTGFYYWFYRFSMNFGYLWPFLSLFVLSFIIPRALKYNFFFISNLSESIFKLFVWFYLVINSFISSIFLNINSFFSFFNIQNNFFLHKKNLFFFSSLFLNVFNAFASLFNIISFYLNDYYDLYFKKYSFENYFLPLSRIHRGHRSFFYYRVFHIITDQKLNK